MSLLLNEQTSLLVFTDWFWQVKTFSCWFLRLMGLLLELQSCWVRVGFEAVTLSTLGSVVGVVVMRGSGRYDPSGPWVLENASCTSFS